MIMKHTILITEQQANTLQNFVTSNTFSYDVLKSTNWNSGEELINYCFNCNLLPLGEGASRKVFQIDDEKVIKIEKKATPEMNDSQNQNEIVSYSQCNNEMKQFVPLIFDYDKKHQTPFWIISEQVLQATYADFRKVLGIDFGSYESSADIEQMIKDLDTYKKYDSKKIGKYPLNLMDFLESYDEGNISAYKNDIMNNQWLRGLYKFLESGLVFSWEIQLIQNWGLVNRNGKPQIVILDIGI